MYLNSSEINVWLAGKTDTNTNVHALQTTSMEANSGLELRQAPSYANYSRKKTTDTTNARQKQGGDDVLVGD
jgi:hypothetical protein